MPQLESVVRISGLTGTTGRARHCQTQKAILKVPLKFTGTCLCTSPTRADGAKLDPASPREGKHISHLSSDAEIPGLQLHKQTLFPLSNWPSSLKGRWINYTKRKDSLHHLSLQVPCSLSHMHLLPVVMLITVPTLLSLPPSPRSLPTPYGSSKHIFFQEILSSEVFPHDKQLRCDLGVMGTSHIFMSSIQI